jgi:iron-sulfur cluster repair protein YtfE (RIC family)
MKCRVKQMIKKEIDAGWRIGEVLKEFPETMAVFKKYLGETCCSHPSAYLETIEFGSITHGLDLDQILRDLNECIASVHSRS